MKQLRKEDLIVDSDGKMVIRKQRQKTEGFFTIPILPIAKQILDKYKGVPLPNDQLLPVPSNQKMNAYLHEIAAICGINKPFTSHVAIHSVDTNDKRKNNIDGRTYSSFENQNQDRIPSKSSL